eukprot:gene4053-14139_t
MAKRKTQKEPVAPSSPEVEDVDGELSNSDDFGSELELSGSGSGSDGELGDLSSSDADDEGEEGGDDSEDDDDDAEADASDEDEELRDAIVDYGTTALRLREEEGEGDEAAGSDASESTDECQFNLVFVDLMGDVPLVWYKDEGHIGYSKDGEKLIRRKKKDKLDALLHRNDSKLAMRTIYDEYNDEEITLTKEELGMIMRIRKGQFPSVDVNPFEEYNDYFTSVREVMPINAAPEPKRRFQPSKHEEKKIVKLVRAMRKGWLKTNAEKEAARVAEPPIYMLWADDNMADSEKTANGLSYIPAQKAKLPGHAESYNPPKEYLATEEEKASWELMDPEDRPKFVPEAFNSLREVPMYASFIKDIFERCLDLYLCPRVRKRRMHIDPESLVPQLPKPRDLMPYPTTLAMKYIGHTMKWLLSGSDDCTIKLWEVQSGRCMRTWKMGAAVESVAWCTGAHRIISAASGMRVVLLPPGVGSAEDEAALIEALKADCHSCIGLPLSGTSSAEGEAALAEALKESSQNFKEAGCHSIIWLLPSGTGSAQAEAAPIGSLKFK